jgi:hypothetical protein
MILNELIKYIKNNRIEIMLHGITHQYFSSGPEMITNSYSSDTFFSVITNLEKIFDSKINFFVPPSNEVSYKNLKTISEMGINTIKSGSYNGHTISEKIMLNFNKLPKLYRKLLFQLGVKKDYLDFFRFKNSVVISAGTFNLNDTFRTYLKKYGIQDGNPIVISTHYESLLNDNYRKSFETFLSEVDSMGYEFVLASEFVRRIGFSSVLK